MVDTLNAPTLHHLNGVLNHTKHFCHEHINDLSLFCPNSAGVTGKIVLGREGDRISKYSVWSFGAVESNYFDYMHIDVTKKPNQVCPELFGHYFVHCSLHVDDSCTNRPSLAGQS